jgi:hypothetical protein
MLFELVLLNALNLAYISPSDIGEVGAHSHKTSMFHARDNWGPLLADVTIKDLSSNDSWFPVGQNDQRIAVFWAQLKSFELLNENSFRVAAKLATPNGGQLIGKMDVNCKNKDYYFRPNGVFAQPGPWSTIEKGSGAESLAYFFCQKTMARSDWGFTTSTSYLWDQPAPLGSPGNAKGEWVQSTNNDEIEVFYNTAVTRLADHVLAATYSRQKKGDRSAAQPMDGDDYRWFNVSCKENLYAGYVVLDQAVPGAWFPPQPGRPGGAAMAIRKQFC